MDAVQFTHEFVGMLAFRLFLVWLGCCIWQVGWSSGGAPPRWGCSAVPSHYLRSESRSNTGRETGTQKKMAQPRQESILCAIYETLHFPKAESGRSVNAFQICKNLIQANYLNTHRSRDSINAINQMYLRQ